jgi:hypothetical protein
MTTVPSSTFQVPSYDATKIRKFGGLDFQKPDGNVSPVFPSALTKNVPQPFSGANRQWRHPHAPQVRDH